ncbi:MAG TPA: hypothetical protein ENI86_13415 [Acidimicrobiales bacterium]|nr:hypothetical protein [Acidimicrobiales bacterium]
MTVATPATTITLPTDTVTLDATTSDPDSGPSTLAYAWSTVSAPAGGTVTFGTPTAEDTTATFNVAGSYTLRLTADDSADAATSDITITVNPEPPAVSTRVTYSIAGQSVAVANNGTLTWILGDNQGSTSTAITAGQATTVRYHPYGTQRGTPTSLPTDRTYTGQTADPTTGLMNYQARYYNPTIGQFTQPDTHTPPGPPRAEPSRLHQRQPHHPSEPHRA